MVLDDEGLSKILALTKCPSTPSSSDLETIRWKLETAAYRFHVRSRVLDAAGTGKTKRRAATLVKACDRILGEFDPGSVERGSVDIYVQFEEFDRASRDILRQRIKSLREGAQTALGDNKRNYKPLKEYVEALGKIFAQYFGQRPRGSRPAADEPPEWPFIRFACAAAAASGIRLADNTVYAYILPQKT